VAALWAAAGVTAVIELIREPAVLPVLCLITLVASAVIMRRRREQPMAAISASLRAAAAGQWVAIDPAPAGACAELAESATLLVNRFRHAILVLAHSSSALSSGRQGIHDVSEAMSSTAESTAAQAASTAATAEQVEGSVLMVATSSEELATAIGAVAKHASEVAEVTVSATAQAARATATMGTLGEASRRIEDLVGLINTIAGQTRMLALNATIEAARAGEAGRGFAVVAEEVRSLAQATADATESVAKSVQDVQAGAADAAAEIHTMVRMIEGIGENQSAIAAAVEQQTSTTSEIGRCASDAAKGSGTIVANVNTLAEAARVTAYAGAQIRTTSGELAAIGTGITAVLADYDLASLEAQVDAIRPPKAVPTAVTRDGVTYVENNVLGDGEAQFEYIGDWCHSEANIETDGTNSYCSQPDAVAQVRFTGSRVRFYSITGPSHGIGAASVDGGEEHFFDTYSPQRTTGVLLYESPRLPHGQHKLTLRVPGDKHPDSRYTWLNTDRVEFE
jgi:methyl-accepting chemotaxis protein